jgi:hypothetical protein
MNLEDIDRVIAKEKAQLKPLAAEHERLVTRGDSLGAMRIRQQLDAKARLVQRLQQERRMATPVDQRTETNAYSRGASFYGSNH